MLHNYLLNEWMNESGSVHTEMKEMTDYDSQVIAFIITNSRNTWKKLRQDTEVYFNAVIWLGCENLFKRFTELLPQIKDTLELKHFEWLNLSDPPVTHKIVLPWCDKTSEHTKIETAGE